MKQGELNVFLIAKYSVRVYFNAKVMDIVSKNKIYLNSLQNKPESSQNAAFSTCF
jgi:hypothetical protein